MSHQEEATIQDVLEAVHEAVQTLTTHINERFLDVEARFNKIEGTMGTMVTKDYLDEKLTDLRGDMIGFFRKENQRTNLVVDKLHEKQVFTDHDVNEIDGLGMFPARRTVV